ncbi:MAG: hypothetical protein HY366_01885, partial [Candidatus Aenigmarchaeota archaeon]|nr:hypothetical protein [Candidatus Aenigmarchaeota archaeon]
EKIVPIVERIDSPSHTFDLELLVAARKRGLTIAEVPFYVVKTRSRLLGGDPKKLFRAIVISFRAFYNIKKKYG